MRCFCLGHVHELDLDLNSESKSQKASKQVHSNVNFDNGYKSIFGLTENWSPILVAFKSFCFVFSPDLVRGT